MTINSLASRVRLITDHPSDMLKAMNFGVVRSLAAISTALILLAGCGGHGDLEGPVKSKIIEMLPGSYRVEQIETMILDEPRDNLAVVRWEADVSLTEELYQRVSTQRAFGQTLLPQILAFKAQVQQDERSKMLQNSVLRLEASDLLRRMNSDPWERGNEPVVVEPVAKVGDAVHLTGKATLVKGKDRWRIEEFLMESAMPSGRSLTSFGTDAIRLGSPEQAAFEGKILDQSRDQIAQWEALNHRLADLIAAKREQLVATFAQGSQWELQTSPGPRSGEPRAILRIESYDDDHVRATLFDPSFPQRFATFEGLIVVPRKLGENPTIEINQRDISPETAIDIKERVRYLKGPSWSKWAYSRGMRNGTERILLKLMGQDLPSIESRQNRTLSFRSISPAEAHN